MNISGLDVLLFVLPYGASLAIGYAVGYMSRNGKIDSLTASNRQLAAALRGEEIRTFRTGASRPVRPVQPRTASVRTGQPLYGPEHAADRTAPLPTGVRYVAAEGLTNEDEIMSDQEYADMVRARSLD